LSVATTLDGASLFRSESMITTGMPRRAAVSTGRARATSSSGASTIASTERLMKFCTSSICCRRSFSSCGPIQMTSTPNSPLAALAPASTAFQKVNIVDLGITAISSRPEASGGGWPAGSPLQDNSRSRAQRAAILAGR